MAGASRPKAGAQAGCSRLVGSGWARALVLQLCAAVLVACGTGEEDEAVLGGYAVRRQPMVLAPGWSTGSTWPTQTVVALNSIVARSSSLVDGDLAVLTAGSGFVHGNAELSILANAEIKGDVQADTIDMEIAGHVFGAAKYNTLTGGGTIDGARSSPLGLPVNLTIVAAANFSAGTGNITSSAGGTATINPGSYNVISVPAGTHVQPTTLRLNAGTYNLGSLTLGNYSRLECKGPCEIRVKGRVWASQYAYIGPGGGGNDQTFTEVKLFVEGTNGTSGANGTPAAMTLGDNAELKAYTFVPNGTLALGANVSGVGKFIAKDIDIGAGAELMTGTSAQRVLIARFVVGSTWPKQVFTAFNSIDLQSDVDITGDTAVIANGTQFLSTSEAVLASGATLHGNLQADKVELKFGSSVTGNVAYNTMVRSGSAGSLSTPLALPLDIHVPVFPLVTPSGKRTTLAARVDVTKDAGRFRDVTLSSGIATDRTVLYLSGGLYEMRNLTLGDYCSVICQSTCELRVKQRLTTGNQAIIGPAVAADASALKIFVWGDTGSTPSRTPFAVSLGTNNDVRAMMFAGRGTLEAKSGSALKGRFIARDIRLGSSTTTEQAGVTDTPPAIQTQPEDVERILAQDATFSVAATGSDITFQWFRDGVAIPGATAGSYTQANVQLADSGAEFTVVVSNALGSVTSQPATLTVASCDPDSYAPTPTSCGVGGCARTGMLSCVAGSIVNTCTPGAPAGDDSLCDGIDNDCNGQTDEDFVASATACGAGACAATGVTSCVHGVVQDSCASAFPAANDATCDGRDDDCNGQVDEDYVPLVTSCGVGACLRHGTTSCSGGAVFDSCNAGNPGSSDSDCDGVDDDCDGEADQDYDPVPTTCGAGACKASGETECIGGTVVNQCTPGNNAPSDTTCNGVDDDCNGQIDEDYVPVPSSCGVGPCARTGMTSCAGGVVQQNCTPGTPAPSDATCNNVDDDCNGQKDEDYVVTKTSCGVGACGRTGQNVCISGSVQNTCTPGSPAASDATCNNIDEDCNGQKDEDFVVTTTSCGLGACARTGQSMCAGGITQNTCSPGTPAGSDAVCNGVDDDCSGQTDEDFVGTATSCGSGTCTASGVTRCVSGGVQDSCVVPTSDADHDGTLDCADACPDDPANDVDGDAVCGDLDNCPSVANPAQDDSDGDGAGDLCDYFPLRAVAAGGSHSCGLLSSGEVVCWGDNASGQLGNGTLAASPSAVHVTGLAGAVEVAAGHAHSCARRSNGQVVCWGANSKGQLGDGSTTGSSTPVTVSGLSDARQLAIGLEHSCALRASGAVVCWGSDQADSHGGQLGNGSASPPAACGKATCGPMQTCVTGARPSCSGPVYSPVPVNVTGLGDAVQVSAGYGHSCALRATGQVVCWGANWYGQIGNGVADLNGASPGTRAPVTVTGLADAVHIDAGDLHTCAVRQSGSVVCWGANWYGQIGNGSQSDALAPATVAGLSDAIMVTAGQHHSCALRQSGAVRCWGYNAYGQLGNGSLADAAVPVDATGISDAMGLSAGELHTCVLRSQADVECWGDAEDGQLGTNGSVRSSVPVAVAGLVDALEVTTGSYHACALRSGGTVSCWGANASGAVGNGSDYDASTAESVSGLSSAAKVAAGDDFTCALLTSGQVRCWGYGDDGQLGNGDTASSSSPVSVTGIDSAIALAAGVAHACAVLSDHTLRCWGDGSAGQLGTGATGSSSTPLAVAGIGTALSVAAGNEHTCVALEDGRVQCWGANQRGQLGNGSTIGSLSPVSALGISGAVAVAASDAGACALQSNGQVLCWGNGATSPYALSGLSDATAIAAGADHACALRSLGDVSCWGSNDEGQLGNGTYVTTSRPESVSGLSSAIQVSAGLYFTCAVRSFGTVYCWGAAGSAQLGNGYPWSSRPLRVLWPVLD